MSNYILNLNTPATKKYMRMDNSYVYEFEYDCSWLAQNYILVNILVRASKYKNSKVFLVGGVVRDMILGRTNPLHSGSDVDLVFLVDPCDLDPGTTYEDVATHLGASEITGRQGNIVYNRVGVDITIKPRTTNAIMDDAHSRDFTMNALYLHITTDGSNKAQLYDPVGGYEDLFSNKLECVKSDTHVFEKDPLRIVRAARFMATLNLQIDEEFIPEVRRHSYLIKDIPGERIRDEFEKVMNHGGKAFSKFIEILDDFNILIYILPEIKALQGLKQKPEHHPEGDVYQHTIRALACHPSANILVLWSILFHDIGKALTYCPSKRCYFGHDAEGVKIFKDIAERLCFNNNLIDCVEYCIVNHMRIHDYLKMNKSKQVTLAKNRFIHTLIYVMFADDACKVENREPTRRSLEIMEYMGKHIFPIMNEDVGHLGNKRYPLDVNGRDLLDNLPIEQGKIVGELLKFLEEQVLDNGLTNTKEALLDKAKEYLEFPMN